VLACWPGSDATGGYPEFGHRRSGSSHLGDALDAGCPGDQPALERATAGRGPGLSDTLIADPGPVWPTSGSADTADGQEQRAVDHAEELRSRCLGTQVPAGGRPAVGPPGAPRAVAAARPQHAQLPARRCQAGPSSRAEVGALGRTPVGPPRRGGAAGGRMTLVVRRARRRCDGMTTSRWMRGPGALPDPGLLPDRESWVPAGSRSRGSSWIAKRSGRSPGVGWGSAGGSVIRLLSPAGPDVLTSADHRLAGGSVGKHGCRRCQLAWPVCQCCPRRHSGA